MMAEHVKESNLDPHEEDSLFNVDFASEGLSWVKGFYQHIGKSVQASCNEYVDACNKYVNTASEHIKRIYDEVCEWEKQCDVDRLSSEICSNEYPTTEDSDESSVKLQKTSDCKQIQPTEDSGLLSVSSTCVEEPVLIEDNRGGECMESTDSRESVQLPTKVNDLCQETIRLPESPKNEKKSQIEYQELVALQLQDNETGGFSNIDNDDYWFDVEKSEIDFIQHCAEKNMSFKKKLRSVFMPKKVHNLAYDNTTSEMMQNTHSSPASSVVSTNNDLYRKESIQDTLELEWELVDIKR